MEQPAPIVRPLRWWPGVVIALITFVAVVVVRLQSDWPFQKRNLTTAQIVLPALVLLLLWWTFLSRAPKRLRLGVTFALFGGLVLVGAMFRIRGVSGDLVPILEPRWVRKELPAIATNGVPTAIPQTFTSADFPQFRGPNRDGVLPGPKLDSNWTAQPPAVLWRQKIGAAWSGFTVVQGFALTQEQRGADECVAAYDLPTGKLLWLHRDAAHFANAIGGEGPRATPTVVSNRVFALGAKGRLNCLDLHIGKVL
jgi:outer membrane protein assembly factor BamB